MNFIFKKLNYLVNVIYFVYTLLIYILFFLPNYYILRRIFYKEKNICQKYNKSILDYMKIKSIIVNQEEKIKKGFILSNHRSWMDFIIDNYLAESTPLGRYMAFIGVFFGSIVYYLDNRVIAFNREKINRKSLYDLCIQKLMTNNYYNQRILIYPEGTRMNYKILNSKDDIKSKFKVGLLKEIYQRKEYPVQIQITSNKQDVIQEKKLYIKKGITLKTAYSKEIHPKDYLTFEEFLDKISEEWFKLWKLTHL